MKSPMERGRELTLLALQTILIVAVSLAVGAGLASAATASRQATFRVADGSVACAYLRNGTLACRNERVAPAMAIRAKGAPRLARVSFAWSASTPVLARGETWRRGAISCRALAREIVCRNGSDSAIFVSRRSVAASIAPAVVD